MCPKSFRPKWSFVESAPARLVVRPVVCHEVARVQQRKDSGGAVLAGADVVKLKASFGWSRCCKIL
jgi:hypothetical protein